MDLNLVMNQVEKSEVIINLIAIVKSKFIAEIFSEKKTSNPNLLFIENNTKKIKELETLLESFYRKLEMSDQEYREILKKIKSYE